MTFYTSVACRCRYWPSPAHLASAPVADISQQLVTLPTAFQALPRPGTTSQLEKKWHSKRSCSRIICCFYMFLSKRCDFLGQSRIDPNSHFSRIPMSLVWSFLYYNCDISVWCFVFFKPPSHPRYHHLSPSVTIVRLSQWRGSRSGCERCGEHRERLLSAIRKQLGHHLGYQLVEPGEDQRWPTWRFWEVMRSPSQRSQQDIARHCESISGFNGKDFDQRDCFRYICFTSHLIYFDIFWLDESNVWPVCPPTREDRARTTCFVPTWTVALFLVHQRAIRWRSVRLWKLVNLVLSLRIDVSWCVDELCTVLSVLQCQGSLYHISPISASEHDSGRWKPAGYLWVSDSRLHVIKISQLWLMWCIPAHSKTETMRNLDFTWGHMGPHIS